MLARNTLGNARLLLSAEGAINWNYFEKLYEVQTNLTLKLANKINQNHIMWHQNKMKVKLATQMLSSSTADALLFLKDIRMQGFQNIDATVKFCRTIDHIFDFLNSRNPFGKGVKTPITTSSISNLESVIIPLVNYLFTLKVKNKNNTISFIY